MAVFIGDCCCGGTSGFCVRCNPPDTLYLRPWVAVYESLFANNNLFNRKEWSWGQDPIPMTRVDNTWSSGVLPNPPGSRFEFTVLADRRCPELSEQTPCMARLRYFCGGDFTDFFGCNFGWPPVGPCASCQGDVRWYLNGAAHRLGLSNACFPGVLPNEFPTYERAAPEAIVRMTPDRLAHDCCCSDRDRFDLAQTVSLSTSASRIQCASMDGRIFRPPFEVVLTESPGGQVDFQGWSLKKKEVFNAPLGTINLAAEIRCLMGTGLNQLYTLSVRGYYQGTGTGNVEFTGEATTQTCSPFRAEVPAIFNQCPFQGPFVNVRLVASE